MTRAAAVEALRCFFDSDHEEFHSQAMAALELASRTTSPEELPITYTTLPPIIEIAFAQRADLARDVRYWPKASMHRVMFTHLDLSEVDFQTADLRKAKFWKCKLHKASFDGANLSECDFSESDIKEASFRDAILDKAKFTNAKNLCSANFRDASVLGMDVTGADYAGAEGKPFSEAQTSRLHKPGAAPGAQPGPADVKDSKPRVLMLLYEYPPVVVGGLWTKASNLLARLQRCGCSPIVLVPWRDDEIQKDAVRADLRVIGVGGEATPDIDPFRPYGAPFGQKSHKASPPNATIMFLQMFEFAEAATRAIRQQKLEFDVVHAHDWMCFAAAHKVASEWKKPWVAHLYSTEFERGGWYERIREMIFPVVADLLLHQEKWHSLVNEQFRQLLTYVEQSTEEQWVSLWKRVAPVQHGSAHDG